MSTDLPVSNKPAKDLSVEELEELVEERAAFLDRVREFVIDVVQNYGETITSSKTSTVMALEDFADFDFEFETTFPRGAEAKTNTIRAYASAGHALVLEFSCFPYRVDTWDPSDDWLDTLMDVMEDRESWSRIKEAEQQRRERREEEARKALEREVEHIQLLQKAEQLGIR